MTGTPLDLVADIGGTNTRVALAEGGVLHPETVTRFRNAEYDGLDAVLTKYLGDHGGPDCAGVCVALAGPVRDGKGKLTNLHWDISEHGLAQTTKAETSILVNDLQAQGHGLGHLGADAIRTVIAGKAASETATQLVVGVGTGFNVCPVYHTAQGRFVPPSEAGHASLPLRAAANPGFVATLEKVHGFAGVEDMLSGRGFERIYRYLTDTDLPASEVMARVADGSDPQAEEAASRFVRMLGAVAGDLSLIHLPFGGVYFVGGVARAFSAYFDRFDFAENFRAKGRFRGLMEDFSVYVVEDDYAALTGCAAYLHSTREGR